MSTSTQARAAALLLAALPAGFSLVGCSLLIESRDRQCESDADCAGFGDATCDVSAGVCVSGDSTGSAACVGLDGCYACAPEKQEEFLNACTDVECVPFDNGALEGLLEEDGSLPPVP